MNAELLTQLQALWRKPREAIPATVDQATLRSSTFTGSRSTTPAKAEVVATTSPVFIDLETQSLCDLSVVGGRQYATDPSTKLISVAAIIDKKVVIWTPHHELQVEADQLWPEQISPKLPLSLFSGSDIPKDLIEIIHAGRPFCAHNATGFDAHVWRAMGLPEPREWIDTLPRARAGGLPGGLDELGLCLFGIGKDESGKKALRAIMKPDKRGRLPAIAPQQLIEVVRYNIQDVALLAGIYAVVKGCGEPDVMQIDATINERGVAFDRELAAKLIALEEAAIEPLCRDMEVATGGAITRSDLKRVKMIREWLQSKGLRLPDLQRTTVENVLVGNAALGSDVRAVLESRLANSRITSSKLQTAIEVCGDDGRLHDQLVYCGAHTGRWTGRGMQPHNLPRPHRLLNDLSPLLPHVDDLEAFTTALPSGVSVADGLSALIRPCFTARPGHVLVIADFAGIEARGVAWCANEQHQLGLFMEGGDNYCDLASQIFGYSVTPSHKQERAVGKVAVLGCGYGMGEVKFADTCIKMGVDLAAAHTSAQAVVEAYRNRYPAIAGVKNAQNWREGGLWKNLERAARMAINERESTAGKCNFYRDDDDLVVELPSGRRMYYRNVRLERDSGPYGDDSIGDGGFVRTMIMFDSPTIKNVTTYGGKLTENVVSAICRDLLANALVQCEREGLPVVLHVHDEIVLEIPVSQAEDALHQLLKIMSTPPEWAAGFPIEVEGFWAERYFKTAPSGTKSWRARAGEILTGDC